MEENHNVWLRGPYAPLDKMDSAIKEKWVRALRSGEYQQGDAYLRVVIDGQQRWCCWGVLCDVAVKARVPDMVWHKRTVTGEKEVVYYVIGEAGHDGHGVEDSGVPSRAILSWAGIHDTPEGWMAEDVVQFLVDANDMEQASFDVIAQWIEENL